MQLSKASDTLLLNIIINSKTICGGIKTINGLLKLLRNHTLRISLRNTTFSSTYTGHRCLSLSFDNRASPGKPIPIFFPLNITYPLKNVLRQWRLIYDGGLPVAGNKLEEKANIQGPFCLLEGRDTLTGSLISITKRWRFDRLALFIQKLVSHRENRDHPFWERKKFRKASKYFRKS